MRHIARINVGDNAVYIDIQSIAAVATDNFAIAMPGAERFRANVISAFAQKCAGTVGRGYFQITIIFHFIHLRLQKIFKMWYTKMITHHKLFEI